MALPPLRDHVTQPYARPYHATSHQSPEEQPDLGEWLPAAHRPREVVGVPVEALGRAVDARSLGLACK